MANENYPTASSQTPQTPNPKSGGDNNRKLIYGILIGALLLTWAYVIYDHTKSKQDFTTMQTQAANAETSKNAIQIEYNEALSRMDSLTGSNTQLQGVLAQQKADIDKLKSRIEDIRRKNNGDLSKAKDLIEELKLKVNNLFAQVAALQKENATLTASNQNLATQNDTLSAQNQQIAANLDASQAETKKIVEEASTLRASAINIEAINLKDGKEKETSKAKKADMLRVSFDLDANRVTASGPKDLYVIVTAPNGRVVSIPSKGSGTFLTKQDGERTYTALENIIYTQGTKKEVSFDWSQGQTRYQTGEYKIEVYNNGYKIGEGVKKLKKSGLFGL